MSVRKYVLSPRLVGSALAVVPVIKATRRPPLGQRNWVLWLAWAGGLALAVATVREESARRVGQSNP
ncbi:hypothetical protein [Gryllotalpicola ginsengisoli]|uniref:hypothetical protein n=1 Tax=Gryllotalpicola ginsengisoli TaxID=444608 RepID=UPI0003B52312|nr:hypothetical protein [Gryllotalpicola ginsengisoli]